MKKLTVIILMCLGLMACKKETTTPASTTPTNGNTLSGVWNYIHIVNNTPYNCNWTFNNDGTMVINDEYDGFNGQTITYSYDSSSKKLTIGGLVVNQLTWESSTKFTTFAYNRITEFTKSNSNTTNSDIIYSYDFLIDGKKYSWSGKMTENSKPPKASKFKNGYLTYINIWNPNYPDILSQPNYNTYSNYPDFFSVSINTDLNKIGYQYSDSITTIDKNKSLISLHLPNKSGFNEIRGGYCKLNITLYDTINKIIKGNVNAVVNDYNYGNNKKNISGNFSLYLFQL